MFNEWKLFAGGDDEDGEDDEDGVMIMEIEMVMEMMMGCPESLPRGTKAGAL